MREDRQRVALICDLGCMLSGVRALLIDLDGVLYVEDEPIAGAVQAVQRLRAGGLALRS